MRTIAFFPKHKPVLALLVLMAMIVALSMNAVAQEPSGAVTTSGPSDPETQAVAAAAEEFWAREMESRNIFDFNIAYLISKDTVAPDVIESEQSLSHMIGAQPFYTWETFTAANELTPFQIILIHDSFYEQVEVEFTRHAYRHQVVLIGIGMPFEHLVEITGDYCQTEPNPAYRDQAHEFVLFFTYAVTLEDERYREQVNERMLGACKDDYDTNGTGVDILVGVTHLFMSDLAYPDYFANLMKSKTITYHHVPLKTVEVR